MNFNQDKLNEIAKPRSEESIAKEKNWFDNKDVILKQHMDKLIESALRDMNELKRKYKELSDKYLDESFGGNKELADEIHKQMTETYKEYMRVKFAINSFCGESQIKYKGYGES